MKFLGIFSCLLLCACITSQPSNAYDEYNEPYQQQYQQQPYQQQYQPVVQPAPVVETASAQYEEPVNPYALEPPAYERNVNIALTEKEEELFQKEKYLMDAKQELYEREKKLADREAAFINRSKALDYKERSINEGRYYAPTTAGYGRPAMPTQPPAPYRYDQPMPYPPMALQPQPQMQPAPYVMDAQPDYMPVPNMSWEGEEPALDLTGYQQPEYDVPQGGFIILQHPIQRDLVRCPVTDDVCLESYERMGYVRAANLSRFTAQDELNTAGTYPTNATGQWRENNTIPRW